MLPTQLLWLCDQVAHAFQVPALCKVRKGRGTHYVFGASEVKSLGHPSDSSRKRGISTEYALRGRRMRFPIAVGVLTSSGRDAGITELFCGLPYFPATDVPVVPGLSVRTPGHSDRQVLRDRVLQVLVHPGGQHRCGQSLMDFDRQWFEDWRPNRTDHDAGIDVVVRPPTLLEVVGTEAGSADCNALVTATRSRAGSGWWVCA